MNSSPDIEIVEELGPWPVVEEKPTIPELPFLQLLIAQEVQYPQSLSLALSQATAEERAILHNVFLKAAASRQTR